MKTLIFQLIFFISSATAAWAQACNGEKLDPRVAAVLRDSIRDLVPQLDTISLEQVKNLRLTNNARYPGPAATRIPITNDSIPITVFNVSGKKDIPIIIYYHPGGFVTPLLPWMETECRKISEAFESIVVAVDYRIAPIHPYPAAVNDAYRSFKWITENGQNFHGDTSKIVLFGLSAGANLVAVISQKAKEERLEKKIKLQVLNCPNVEDIRASSRYPSYDKYQKGYFLTKQFLIYAQRSYAGNTATDNPEISPIRAIDLRGQAPAVIISAEFDILRDEICAYATRLRDAGVKTWYKCFQGQIHCLVGLPENADEFDELNGLIRTAMKEVL